MCPCERATRCCVCGEQLCSPETHTTHKVRGHYVRWEGDVIKIFCISCYASSKKAPKAPEKV